MNAHYIRLLFCLIGTLVSASVASAFEGKVNMLFTHGKDAQTVTYYIKGAKMRMEFAPPEKKKKRDGTMAMIADWDKKQMYMIMQEEKAYMVMNVPNPDELADKHQMDYKPTGKKEKIAGYEAEEYVGTSEGKKQEMWVTKALGNFIMANQRAGGRGKMAGYEQFMRKNDFFALRMIQRGKDGVKEEFRMEVQNVDKEPQADTLFQPPSDFQRIDLPNMGGMLKGLIPGGNRDNREKRE